MIFKDAATKAFRRNPLETPRVAELIFNLFGDSR